MKNPKCEQCKAKILKQYEGNSAVLVRKLSPAHKYWICPACSLYGQIDKDGEYGRDYGKSGRRQFTFGRIKKEENGKPV